MSTARRAPRAVETPGAPESGLGPRPLGRPRSEACRRRILKASRDLLEEVGFRAMTMEAIAERAETSKVTLYRWWSHKAAVVLDAMLEEVSPILPYREKESPLGALRDQMVSFSRFLRTRKARLFLAVVAEGVLDVEVGDALRAHWVAPRREDAKQRLARAVEAGEIREDVDLDVVLDSMFGPLYHRAILGHMPVDEEFALAVFECATQGVATPEGQVWLGKGEPVPRAPRKP